MKFIETLREGEKVGDIYLCKYKQAAVTKNGKAYENVILQDKTGTIDAKIWDPDSQGIDDFAAMDYVDVVGDVTNFQGTLQLNIKRVRRAREGEYNPEDYLPVSERDIEEMYRELMGYVDRIENEYLRKLTNFYFRDNEGFIKAFKFHSAAKSVHHGFVGGLLEHTLGVVKLCDFYVKQYPLLNRDLLFTAALFHDVGKMRELSTFPENDYTDDGQLLGHIYMGAELVGATARRIQGFPKKLLSELMHCILAHHGELEYGSPKKPALLEALALNLADNTDAKMQTFKEALKGNGDNTDWLGYNRLFESGKRAYEKGRFDTGKNRRYGSRRSRHRKDGRLCSVYKGCCHRRFGGSQDYEDEEKLWVCEADADYRAVSMACGGSLSGGAPVRGVPDSGDGL